MVLVTLRFPYYFVESIEETGVYRIYLFILVSDVSNFTYLSTVQSVAVLLTVIQDRERQLRKVQ